MSIGRTGKLIVSCCGAALVVGAVGVVLIGGTSKNDAGSGRRPETEIVPAKLGPTVPSGDVAPPVSEAPVSVTPSLSLGTGETYIGKGREFSKNGDFASASRYLEAEVGQHPDRFDPTYLLGISLWKEGRLPEAITSLTSAASLSPKSTKARVNLGRVLNDSGRFQEALVSSEEAITLDPESSSAHNVRGRALLNLGRKDEAIETFKTAVEKDPTNAFAQNNLGYALIQAGRFDEAVPSLTEAVRLKPEIGIFQNNLGMAYERTGQKEQAIEAYRRAVQAGGSENAERNLARLGGTVDNDSVSGTEGENTK